MEFLEYSRKYKTASEGIKFNQGNSHWSYDKKTIQKPKYATLFFIIKERKYFYMKTHRK